MANGLIAFQSAGEIDQRERDKAAERSEEQRRREGFESNLAAHIRRAWERNYRAKFHIQERMIDCLRARNGEYDPETLQEIEQMGGSKIYMMLTAVKCRAAKSWIRDIMLPANDRAWGLEPTPVPDVPPRFMEMIKRQALAEVQKMAAQGQPIPPEAMADVERQLQARLKRAAEERAKTANEKHERLIADQLEQAGYRQQMSAFLDDFTTFPSAILKGPLKKRIHSFSWGEEFTPIPTEEMGDEIVRVSPFDIYPAPDGETCEDGEFIEHLHLGPKALYDCIGLPGYSEHAIREVLRAHGQDGLHEWLFNSFERARLEDKSTAWMNNRSSTIDGLHYWGPAQGLLLLQWGVPAERIPDPIAFYECEAILIKHWVVKVRINDDPLKRRPYQKASYQSRPGAFWGIAIPELMADIQRVCNATARSLVNNMAMSSGPMAEIYADRLADGETADRFYPWRRFFVKDSETTGNNRAITFFQPQSNAVELMGVFEKFEIKADDATNIPRYAYGNERLSGAASTSSGLSMLMESASKGIKEAISGIDQDVIRPLIEKMWFNNMLYSADDSIKGDSKVVARGASVLVAKDAAIHRRMEALQITSNPQDAQIFGIEERAKIYRQLFTEMNLPDDIIPSADELKQRLGQQSKQKSPAEREQDRKDAELTHEVKMDQAEHALKTEAQKADEAEAMADASYDQGRLSIEKAALALKARRGSEQ